MKRYQEIQEAHDFLWNNQGLKEYPLYLAELAVQVAGEIVHSLNELNDQILAESKHSEIKYIGLSFLRSGILQRDHTHSLLLMNQDYLLDKMVIKSKISLEILFVKFYDFIETFHAESKKMLYFKDIYLRRESVKWLEPLLDLLFSFFRTIFSETILEEYLRDKYPGVTVVYGEYMGDMMIVKEAL